MHIRACDLQNQIEIEAAGFYLLVKCKKPAEKSMYLYLFYNNMKRLRKGCFVVGNELITRLYLRVQAEGYKIPNIGRNGSRIRPDISVAYHFHKYLLSHKIDVFNKFSKDFFTDVNGEEFFVRHYSNELLPNFVAFFEKIWLVEHAEEYFRERDPNTMEYLKKLIGKENQCHENLGKASNDPMNG